VAGRWRGRKQNVFVVVGHVYNEWVVVLCIVRRITTRAADRVGLNTVKSRKNTRTRYYDTAVFIENDRDRVEFKR